MSTENKKQKFTPLAEVGEFGLIDLLKNKIPIKNENTKIGIGDDAAVLSYPSGSNILVSTDTVVEGVHFNLAYHPIAHLGYKAITTSISDICAMNGIPKQVLVSLQISNRFSVEMIEEIYKGMGFACEKYGVDLIGGDTTSSASGLAINVTAIGESKKPVKRSTAKENDLLVLTGDVGAAYLGYQVLNTENEVFQVNPNNQPDLEKYKYLLQRQLRPEARKDIVELLEQLKVLPTSMIDISDGLASEVLHLCHESGLGINLYEEKIPMDPMVYEVAESYKLASTIVALNGGEDYELLFSISPNDFEKLKGNPHFTVIGHFTAEGTGRYMIGRGGDAIELTAQGWDAFLKRE